MYLERCSYNGNSLVNVWQHPGMRPSMGTHRGLLSTLTWELVSNLGVIHWTYFWVNMHPRERVLLRLYCIYAFIIIVQSFRKVAHVWSPWSFWVHLRIKHHWKFHFPSGSPKTGSGRLGYSPGNHGLQLEGLLWEGKTIVIGTSILCVHSNA